MKIIYLSRTSDENSNKYLGKLFKVIFDFENILSDYNRHDLYSKESKSEKIRNRCRL